MASQAEVALIVRMKDEVSKELDGISGKFGGLGKVIAGAGIGAAAGKAAEGIAEIGTTFDDVYDGLVVQTGATGTELAGLEQSFRDVVGNVPTDFETAGAAVGTLSQRLGLTGQPLTDMATQMANLSRITGTDVVTNSEAAADAMLRMNIPAAEQGPLLDKLFKASQESGVGFAELASSMGKYSPQLEAMGLSASDSAALLGAMGQAGVDTAAVMPGLGRALGDMVKEGVDPAQGLSDIFAKVQAEGPNSATAMETFGAKGGLALGNLIADGKLNYQAFADTISTNAGTINDAATSTDDMQQKIDLLKNKAKLALEPLAGLGTNIAPFADKLPALLGGVGGLAPKLVAMAGGLTLSGVQAGIASVATGIFGTVSTVASAGVSLLAGAVAFLTSPIGLVVIAIVALIAIGVLLYKHWDEVKAAAEKLGQFLGEKWDEIKEKISAAVDAIKKWVTEKWDAMTKAITDALENVRTMISQKWDAIKEYLTKKVEEIKTAVEAAWNAIKTAITDTLDKIKTSISDKFHEFWQTVVEKMEQIRAAIDAAWKAAKALVEDALDLIGKAIKLYIEGWKTIIEKALEIGKWLWDTITGAVTKVKDALADLAEKAIAAGIALWKDVVAGALKLGEWIGDVIDILKGPGTLIEKIKAVGGAIVQGLKDGISAAFTNFVEFFKGLFPNIIELAKQILGIASPSKVFHDIGLNVVKGFEQGLLELPRMLDDRLIAPIEDALGRVQLIATQLGGVPLAAPAQAPGGEQIGVDPAARARAEAAAVWAAIYARVNAAVAAGPQKQTVGGTYMNPEGLRQIFDRLDWSQMQRSSLDSLLKNMGFSDEVRAGLRDLHTMRGPKGWLTDEAREAFRRRQGGRKPRTPKSGTTYGGSPAGEMVDPNSIAPDDNVTPVPVGVGDLRNPSAAPTEMKITDATITSPGAVLKELVIQSLVVNPKLYLNGLELARALMADRTSLDVMAGAVAVKLGVKMSTAP